MKKIPKANSHGQDSKYYSFFLVCIFMVEETFIWIKMWKKQEDLITYLKRQDVHQCSSKCPPLLIALSKKKKIAFFKGYIYTQGISMIWTINAPKWQQSAANWGNMPISELSNVFEPGCAFRLNSANYKRKN